MVLKARQLGGDDADVFGALRNLNAGQLFDGQRVGPVIGEGAEIVEPVGVGHRAEIGFVLGNFFVVAMQVAEDRLQLHDALAVQHHVHAKDAVGGGMLRAHRDFEQLTFTAAGRRRGRDADGLCRCAHCAPMTVRCCRTRSQDFVVRRRLVFVIVRLDVVPAHGVVLETIPHQDAAQIGMAVEDDAVEVEDFPLLKFGAAPDGSERGQMDPFAAIFGAHAENDGTVLFLHREEVVDDFKIADGVGFADLFNLLFNAVDNLFHFYFF